jgi:hypothetical protein
MTVHETKGRMKKKRPLRHTTNTKYSLQIRESFAAGYSTG